MRRKLTKWAVLVLALILLFTSFSFSGATSSGITSSPGAVSLKKAKVSYKTKGAYTGSIHEIAVTVKLNGVTLVEGKDYLVSGNETAGAKAKKYKIEMVIIGIGGYKGFITKKFSYTITKVAQKLSVTAGGEAKTVTLDYATLKTASQQVQLDVSDLVLDQEITGKLVWKTTKKIKATQTGLITVPKGLKKGTYTLRVYAASGTNYNKSSYQYIKIVVK